MEERCCVPCHTKWLLQLEQRCMIMWKTYSATLWTMQYAFNMHAKMCLLCGSLEEIGNFYIHMNAFVQDFPNGTRFNYCYFWLSSENCYCIFKTPQSKYLSLLWKETSTVQISKMGVWQHRNCQHKSWWKEARVLSSI